VEHGLPVIVGLSMVGFLVGCAPVPDYKAATGDAARKLPRPGDSQGIRFAGGYPCGRSFGTSISGSDPRSLAGNDTVRIVRGSRPAARRRLGSRGRSSSPQIAATQSRPLCNSDASEHHLRPPLAGSPRFHVYLGGQR